MKKLAVEGSLLSVDGGVATVTSYITNPNMSVDNKKACHSINYTVTLSPSGATGSGTITGSSSFNLGDNQPFVLEGDSFPTPTMNPPTPTTPTPTPGPTVIVKVSFANQSVVEMD